MNHFRDKNQHCCIETAKPEDDWLPRIGQRFLDMSFLRSEDIWDERTLEDTHICSGKLHNQLSETSERSIYDILEEDPVNSYNLIKIESAKSHDLIPRLAVNLTAKTIEVICDQIFTKQDIDQHFVQLFCRQFFLNYLKRVYSWSSLHLLIKASKAYPEHFKITLKTLLEDTNLKNNILLDYVQTLNEKECTNLVKFLSEFQLTPEEFDHNLPSIYFMYKNCLKDDYIHQYMLCNLGLYNQYCAYNINYGRLLLCFIQTLSGFNIRIKTVKRMIENHRTSYKGLCMTALEKLVIDILALQANFYAEPRFVIPRSSESSNRL